MKTKTTAQVKANSIKALSTKSLLVAAAVFMAVSGPMGTYNAYADSFDDQIRAIQNEVSNYQQQAAVLAEQANTLQNAVNALNAQKNTIQAQLNLSQAKYDQLVRDIADNETKLEKQKNLLKTTLTQLYVNGKQSPVEVLASSKSIGEYVDQQEYRSTVRDQVMASMKKIKTLQEQLAKQKVDVERVLADQKTQRDDLAAKEAEQANLLAQTQGQEANYQSLISQRNSDINRLQQQQAAQAAALARYRASSGSSDVAGDPSKGGYPARLANAPLNSIVDSWGMYNRQCVSYVAWKVDQKTGGNMPYWGGKGNAYEWPANARNAKPAIPVNTTPAVGSVAVWGTNDIGGGYGHVAWVEAVNSDGSIYVSQYNYTPASYSEMRVSAAEVSRLEFIHF